MNAHMKSLSLPHAVADRLMEEAGFIAATFDLDNRLASIIEKALFRGAGLVIEAQREEREAIAREICERAEMVTVRGYPYPIKDFVGER